MGVITGDKLSDFLYYKKLPAVYREYDDKYTQKDLYRYLHSLFEGGEGAVSDASNLKYLTDPERCPEAFFPYLYSCFGLPFFYDIATKYHRKFLNNVGEFIKRRGTYGGVRYLVRVLTGMECDYKYYRGIHQGQKGRFLFVTLIADTLEQVLSIETSIRVVERFLRLHVPYYIDAIIVTSRVSSIKMTANVYMGSSVGVYKDHNLLYNPYKYINGVFGFGTLMTNVSNYNLLPQRPKFYVLGKTYGVYMAEVKSYKLF